MNRSLLLTLAFVVLAGFLSAEAADDVSVRAAKDIVLHFADGTSETVHLAVAPYIQAGVVTLFAGDDILIEFDLVNGAPKNPRVVKTNDHPERTLELKMTQDKDIAMVVRNSGFVHPLTMDCYFLLLHSDFKNNANMFPLEKGLGSFDSFDPKAYCIKFFNFGLN